MSADDLPREFALAGSERPYENPGAALHPGAPRPPRALAHRHAFLPRPIELFELLLAERAAFPLLGREAEMAGLQAWLRSPTPVLARCLSGPSGIGKTRLALALCQSAEISGWSACFADANVLQVLTDLGRALPRHGSALVVLEEPGDSIARLAQWLAGAGSAVLRANRLRILLLAREAEAGRLWLAELASAGVTTEPPGPVHLSALPVSSGAALFARALEEADRLGNRSHRGSRNGISNLAIPVEASPLHLILAGLAEARRGPAQALALPAAALARDVAELERTRLERVASACLLSARLVTHVAACITLQTGCGLEQAAPLIQEEARAMGFHLPLPADQVVDCLADALLSDGGMAIAPIRPEIVGGAFVIAELAHNPADVQEAIIMRALSRGGSATARVLRGMAAEHAERDPSHSSRAWAQLAY